MAVKDRATLHADVLADISSATAPDSITPTIDGANRDDIIDSCWNKIDDPAPSNAAAVTVSGLVIPSCITGATNGDTVADFIQEIINLLCQLDSSMAIQGVAGQFLATIPTAVGQTFRVNNTLGVDVANLLVPNDVDDGGFDNGNNYDTASYLTPAAGFTGRFMLSNVEIELVDNISGSGTANLEFCLQVNGVDVGSAVIATFALTGMAVGTLKYATTIVYPAFGAAAQAFNPGDIVTIRVSAQSATTGDAVLRVNNATFSNQPV
jgi:hypothetical protein